MISRVLRQGRVLRHALPVLLLFAVGCPKGGGAESGLQAARPEVPRPSSAGWAVVEVDLNSDGVADVFNYFRDPSQLTGPPARRDVDLNWDGRVDVVSFYDPGGLLLREEFDGDFDGRVDIIDHYAAGRRVLSEVDTEYDGRIDLWKYYQDDVVRQRERDTTGDGTVDLWETFDAQGALLRTERDADGDGRPDPVTPPPAE